jgi:hypothetical protein
MPSKKLPAPTAPLDVNQRYSVAEALAYLRTSRKSFYDKLAPSIAFIREGTRTFVPGSEIARLSRPDSKAAA